MRAKQRYGIAPASNKTLSNHTQWQGVNKIKRPQQKSNTNLREKLGPDLRAPTRGGGCTSSALVCTSLWQPGNISRFPHGTVASMRTDGMPAFFAPKKVRGNEAASIVEVK